MEKGEKIDYANIKIVSWSEKWMERIWCDDKKKVIRREKVRYQLTACGVHSIELLWAIYVVGNKIFLRTFSVLTFREWAEKFQIFAWGIQLGTYFYAMFSPLSDAMMCSTSQHDIQYIQANKDAFPSPQNLDYAISKRKRNGEENQIKVGSRLSPRKVQATKTWMFAREMDQEDDRVAIGLIGWKGKDLVKS